MIEINLLKIPPWLAKSKFLQPFYDNLEDLEIGSDEYIEQMKIPINVPFFNKTEYINNLKEFINIINTANFFIVKYPITVYLYIYQNKNKVLDNLELEYRNSFEKEENITNDINFLNSYQIRLLEFINSIKNNDYLINNKNDIIWHLKNENKNEKLLNDFIEDRENNKIILKKYYKSSNIFNVDIIQNGKVTCSFDVTPSKYFEILKNLFFNDEIFVFDGNCDVNLHTDYSYRLRGPLWEASEKEIIIFSNIKDHCAESEWVGDIMFYIYNISRENIIKDLEKIIEQIENKDFLRI